MTYRQQSSLNIEPKEVEDDSESLPAIFVLSRLGQYCSSVGVM